MSKQYTLKSFIQFSFQLNLEQEKGALEKQTFEFVLGHLWIGQKLLNIHAGSLSGPSKTLLEKVCLNANRETLVYK